MLTHICPIGPRPNTATVPSGGIVGVLHRLPGGREDVREQQSRARVEPVVDLHRAEVRLRHAEVLRLAAGTPPYMWV
jgi:hypothetical protein